MVIIPPMDMPMPMSSSSATVKATKDDRAWAEAQAQKQMDFQERMANTAWQRAVDDMKNAGLNPALAYMQGSAFSPSGSVASTSSTEQKAKMQTERMMFGLMRDVIKLIGGR